MQKIIALIVCWCWFLQASAQPNITSAEYFVDTDPGFGKATSISITTPSPNIIDKSFDVALGSVSQGVHTLFIRSRDANGKWSITNRFVFYKPSATAGSAASNIIKAEYFFDTDPGFGNAINIPLAPGVNVADVAFAADISALSVGVHTLYLRSRNADGKWSITNRQVLYKPNSSGASGATNIVKAEYFFDTDPGFGSATNIPITAGIDVQNVNFSADIASLSTGVHQLFIRSKSADGKWSVTNRRVLYKPNPASGMPAANITEVEYFIDTDPGFGKAVPIAINPAVSLVDFLAPINISGLSVGDHTLFIRSKTDSNWSITNAYTFPIASTAAAPFINVNAITKTVLCARDSVKLSFDARGTFNAGNVFNAELSDANGSFATPVIIGTFTGTTSAIIAAKMPNTLVGGTNFRVRVSSTNPVVTGLTGTNVLTIGNRSLPQTITGPVNVNGTLNYNYNVPAITGSTWSWNVTAGSQTSGGTTNSIAVTWNQPVATTAIGTIKLVETNYNCLGDTSMLTATIYKLRIGIVTPASACKGFEIVINASADGAFSAGNTLTAQLSSATGSFAAPVTIGSTSLVGNGLNQPAVINAIIPINVANGTNYRVRVLSSTGGFIGDTSNAISILKPDLGADVTRSKCVGFVYDLTQNFTDAALTYAYFTQSFNALAQPANAETGVYQIVATNSIGCKDTVTITVTNFPKPNIGADKSVSKCPVEMVDLTSLFTTTGLTSEWNVATPSAVQAPGVYRLIVTNSDGCKDTAFVTVINFDKPDVGGDQVISKCPVETLDLTALFNTTGLTSVWDVANPSAIQNPGTYRLIVTSSNGCKDTAFVTVSNYARPALGADVAVAKCIGFTTNISNAFVTTGLTLEWDTPTPSAVETGIYRLIVTNANSCKDTAFVTVTNAVKPNLGADQTISAACANGTADITTLYNTSTYTSVLYSVANPQTAPVGSYELIVTNSNGCKDTATITVVNAPIATVASTPSNTKTANRECTDGEGWTHYYNDNGSPLNFSDDVRLLSVKKNGQNIGTPGDGTFELKVMATARAGTGQATVVQSPLVTAGTDFYSMNRYWNVIATNQPASPVAVRFYYNSQDLADVNGDYPPPAIDHSSLQLYKLEGGNPDPTTNWAGATAVQFYTNGNQAGTATWVYTSLGNNIHQAEFVINRFSGGGAGGVAIQTLPVTLTHFDAVAQPNSVRLNWSTSTESNTKSFAIQRSLDGRNFATVGEVSAANNSSSLRSYSYNDVEVMQYRGTLVYYRLLQSDLNGQQKLSDIRKVRIGGKANQLHLQFNPVRSEAILQYQSLRAGKVSVSVTDMSGRVVLLKQLSVVEGANQIKLSTMSLAQGIYEISVVSTTDRQHVRMLKQ